MTQPQPPYPYPPYPSPYAPPQPVAYYGAAPDPLLAPARRASIMMYVLGGLIVLLGFCNGTQALIVNADELLKAQERFAIPGTPTAPFSAQTYRTLALVGAAVTLVVGMLFIALGTPVRRGSRGATIASIVLSGLILAGALLMALAAGVMTISVPPMAICACGSIIPAGLLGLLIVWLVQSLRAAANWKLAQAQYLSQYWQYQQAQAQAGGAYGYGGYGYGAPQSQQPPQAQPTPPPPSPDSSTSGDR